MSLGLSFPRQKFKQKMGRKEYGQRFGGNAEMTRSIFSIVYVNFAIVNVTLLSKLRIHSPPVQNAGSELIQP